MSFTAEERLEEIARALHGYRAVPSYPVAGETWARASVALVMRVMEEELELLLIERATRSGDPWSGHMALPGGRRESRDASGQATAVRETFEEVGIDLRTQGRYLGRLDEVRPRSDVAPIVVSPYVFTVPPETAVRPNYEVADAFWAPLNLLTAPHAATEYLHAHPSGETYRFPAIGYRERTVWGLTYRIVTDFLRVAGIAAEPREAR